MPTDSVVEVLVGYDQCSLSYLCKNGWLWVSTFEVACGTWRQFQSHCRFEAALWLCHLNFSLRDWPPQSKVRGKCAIEFWPSNSTTTNKVIVGSNFLRLEDQRETTDFGCSKPTHSERLECTQLVDCTVLLVEMVAVDTLIDKLNGLLRDELVEPWGLDQRQGWLRNAVPVGDHMVVA